MSMASFGLTDREGHIVNYLARGLSSAEIAAELCLSTYTVRDHVKAILRKCEVSSRGEFVARLFADRMGPAVHATAREAARRTARGVRDAPLTRPDHPPRAPLSRGVRLAAQDAGASPCSSASLVWNT